MSFRSLPIGQRGQRQPLLAHVSSVIAIILLSLLFTQRNASGVDLVTLDESNWDEYRPRGKEVDCIYGDFVFRNEHLTMVVGRPVAGRNANMTVRNVAGMIVDMTERKSPNDQLSAYYPGGAKYTFSTLDGARVSADGRSVPLEENVRVTGKSITLELVAAAATGRPGVRLRYSLADDQNFVLVETVYENYGTATIEVETSDSIRADRTFSLGSDPDTSLFWAHDDWFQQAYGVIVEGHQLVQKGTVLELLRDGSANASLEPESELKITRKIFPARGLLELRGLAARLASQSIHEVEVQVRDPSGPVTNAQVRFAQGERMYGSSRTPADGTLRFRIPPGEYRVTVSALGRPDWTQDVKFASDLALPVVLAAPGYVLAHITEKSPSETRADKAIPCKVAFYGKDGTPDPYFGPDSGAVAVMNLVYSHNGRFRQELAPGRYDVVISHGPEYDAVFTELDVRAGQQIPLVAELRRVVNSPGWVSSDFHSHSSPSGDNTSSQLGRVLNLLCEHIEFAPCTEHNRLSTYTPHLRRLGAEALMATCTGIELTGSAGTVNHQNAFPLIRKPRTQDGGAPLTDENPVAQIERLALWDSASDKLVQTNHPNIVQILGDRDLDGKPDGGFEAMFGFMDVIEVHPPETILAAPTSEEGKALRRNAIFNWMQLINLGYRIPGVVNTDAHYNFHGSGGLRNYLRSPTDDPAEIQTMDVVHAAERGQLVMTTGPFMEVQLRSDNGVTAGPGDDIAVSGGRATLHVRVQCPNWFDINRVQVFLNGRPQSELNYTRRGAPNRFADGAVKFDQQIPLDLPADTHIIVAAAGEGLQLGRVMGPDQGKQMPIAVSNPIFADVDGGGFKPNGDQLDVPLPRSGER